MNTRIFVTKPISPGALDLLAACGELDVGPEGRNLTADALCERVRGCAALLPFVADPITAEVLEAAAPTCKIVANFGVGYDNIDVPTATRLGIRVTNTPDVLTDATADLTFALILAAGRGLNRGEALARSGQWEGIEPLQIFGRDVSGKVLGIVGPGRIGTAVARRAGGFDMTVVYCSRRQNDELEAAGARRLRLDDLLQESDYVSLHVPLTPDTRHLIAAEQLRRMKPTACLINTARGAVVCQRDLIRALREGWIAAAGLDVYENEPRIPAELLELPNVVCLPHMGSATVESREQISMLAARNVVACLEGRPLLTPVN